MKRAIGLAALVAALSTIAPNAQAFVREESNWNPASLPIRYSINLSTAPSSIGSAGAKSAVEGGFASWAAPTCTAWRTTDLGDTTTRASSSDGKNTILWVSGSWPAALGDVSSVIGVTTPVWTSGGYFIDADIQFNAVGFSWSNTGSGSTVDTQSIATHEEGHFLGLAHATASSAIMYASYSGGIKRTLTSDDISGVCTIYPSGTAPPDAGTTDSGGGGGATGSPCSTSTDCTSTICVSDGTTTYCSATCTSDCGCPSGFTCVATTTPGEKVCAVGANTCSTGTDAGAAGGFDAPCTANSQCLSNLCVAASGATTGFCSRTCADDTTCPCGFQCTPTTTSGVSVCAPGKDTCVDAGVVDASPPKDTGGDTSAKPDAPGKDATGADAGDDATVDDDAAVGAGDSGADDTVTKGLSGCGCTTPAGGTAPTKLLVLSFAALGAVLLRRLRRRQF